MKYLISFLFPIMLNAQSDIGWLFINENTIDLDKQIHAVAGMWIGTNAYFIAYQGKEENRGKARFWGVAAPLIVGTVKELADMKTTGFDTKDLAYTVAGGVLVTLTFDIMTKKRHKKK